MGSNGSHEGLTEETIATANGAFRGLLRRKRTYSSEFIERNCADLMAQARLELSTHLAAGEEIESPVGWLLTCAEKRARSKVELESRTPRAAPLEPENQVADPTSIDPESEALKRDRYRKVMVAIRRLRPDERKVIELIYFKELSVRQAGERLAWDKSKVQDRKQAALAHLEEFLGVKDSRSLQLVLVAAASRRRFGMGPLRVIARIGEGVERLTGRLPQPAQRAVGRAAAEPSFAASLSTIGRGAGACSAALAVCLATGFLGPGVGSLDLLQQSSHSNSRSGSHQQNRPARHAGAQAIRVAARAPRPHPEAPRLAATSAPSESVPHTSGGRRKAVDEEKPGNTMLHAATTAKPSSVQQANREAEAGIRPLGQLAEEEADAAKATTSSSAAESPEPLEPAVAPEPAPATEPAPAPEPTPTTNAGASAANHQGQNEFRTLP